MSGVMRSQFTENYKKDLYDYFWDTYPDKPAVWESVFYVKVSDAA